MRALPRPEVIITHESDLDGLISGVLLQRLAQKLFNAEIPLQAYNYTAWRQRDLREGAAWVCDLAFETRMDRPGWVLIDHHSVETAPSKAILIHSLTKSAGLLCYELCQEQGLGSHDLDRLIRLNDVSDLFLEDDHEFELANDYASLVKVYQFWKLHALIDGEIERLLDHPLLEVMAVRRRIENPLGLAWSRNNIVPLSSTVGFVDTVVGNSNVIVHELLEQSGTRYSVLVTLFRRSPNVMVASFRSRNGEALKVAERFQGGGHPNAAGATLPRSLKTTTDALGYLRKILSPGVDAAVPLNDLERLLAQVDSPKPMAGS